MVDLPDKSRNDAICSLFLHFHKRWFGRRCSSYWRSVLLAVRRNARYRNRKLVQHGVLKFNGAKFSATDYPVLAKVFPSLVLPEARGDFIRIWDDGRGVDSGRALLSAQSDDFKTHEHKILGLNGSGSNVVFGTVSNASPLYTSGVSQPAGSALPAFQNPGGTETRPRNIAFNFLVRAK